MPQHDTSQNGDNQGGGPRRVGRRLFIAGILVVLMSFPILGWWSQQAPELGATEGKLQACPDSPNCVSSQAADDTHHVAALTYEGDPASAMARLREVIRSLPRTKIIEEEAAYIRAECRSLLMRYVDDLEVLLDETTQVIHIRSASRVGYSDMGVNRQRVEHIRDQFAG